MLGADGQRNHHESRAAARRSPWSWWLAIGVPTLVFLAVIAVQYDGRPYLRGDCQYYYFTAVSLLEDHDLDLANNLTRPLVRHSDDVSLDTRGRLVPKHPIWMALFALPLIAAFGAPGALVFNLLQLVLLLYLATRLAARYSSPWDSSIAIALTGVTSILPHYAWNFSPDIFSCVLLVAGMVALPANRSANTLRLGIAGLLFGLAAISKFSLFLALPALPLLCGRPFRKSLPALVLGLLVPAALFSALNFHLFGSPLTTSYDRMARIEGDVVVVHSQRSDFGIPVLEGVRGQIMDRANGLLFTSPITLLSLLGLYPLARHDRGAALYLILTFLAVFLFFSFYGQWRASHFGNRFLMPISVLAAVPLAALLDAVGLFRFLPGRRLRGVPQTSTGPPPVREQGHEQS